MSTHGSIKRILTLAIVAAIFSIPVAGLGQNSFNIDLDCEFCPPEGGGGRPSSSFFAAAGPDQAGFWNLLDASGDPPTRLRNLAGELTDMIVSGPTSGVEGGNNFQGQPDNRFLMNDFRQVASSSTWTFDGVPSGNYIVISYAVYPWHESSYNPTPVTVTGGGTKLVTGPMAVDQFIEGRTHVTHFIQVSNGSFSIRVDRGQFYSGAVNGFQIVSVVPEPSLVVGMTTGLLALSMRRRRKPS
ncbi:MAG: PEP-CTERM sorting domain-containing protein [Fimbriimonadaceae bacterium]